MRHFNYEKIPVVARDFIIPVFDALLKATEAEGYITAEQMAEDNAGAITEVQVRSIIHYLRTDENMLICSTTAGYRFALNAADLDQTINHFASRIREMSEALRALERGQSRIRLQGSYTPERPAQITLL